MHFLGFLQLIGCLGALRLSEKLLNAYWFLLLLLLVGDAISGVFWVYKFEKIMQELQPMLRLVFLPTFIDIYCVISAMILQETYRIV